MLKMTILISRPYLVEALKNKAQTARKIIEKRKKNT